MKRTTGFLLIVVGVIFITISILALVKAFEIFNAIGTDSQSLGYVFGSIVFPLLITVIGRWLFRKGMERWRTE